MPAPIKPYDPSELDEVAALAHEPRQCWTIKLKEYGSPLLIWADSQKQAAAIAAKRKCDCCNNPVTITSIRRNYHAENMTPRPNSWTQFVMQGGGQ